MLNIVTRSLFSPKPISRIYTQRLYTSLNGKNIAGTMGEKSYRWSISLTSPEGHHDPIKLHHKVERFIGRIPEMRIVDPRCSRKQVKLVADLELGEVKAMQMGPNSSSIDGIEMIQNKEYTMKRESTLCVLTGLFPQKLLCEKHAGNNNSSKKSNVSVPNISGSSHQSEKKSGKPSTSHSKPADKISSGGGIKRPSSSHESDRGGTKRPSSSHESDRGGTKRPSSSHEIDHHFKKPKLDENGVCDRKKFLTKSNSDDDQAHVKNVEAKLAALKSLKKDIKTPSKSPRDAQSLSDSSKLSSTTPSRASSASSSSSGSSPSPLRGKPAPESRWDQFDEGALYVYTSKGLQSSRRIAAFDIDGTIITTQSGKVFPTNPGDWNLLYQREIPKKLKKLLDDGYKIVFITNQLGVSRGKTSIFDLKRKFVDVLEELLVPVQILMSTKGGPYRKPCTGMWKHLCDKANDGIEIELSQSFYVGDAAGRPKDWRPKKKKDFSSSDRLFALNIGLDFYTPEEYFLGYETAKNYVRPEFDPRKDLSKLPLLEPAGTKMTSKDNELIVLVGSPASGKSYFANQYLVPKGYHWINRDTLGTWQKCVTACKDKLRKNESVVVDNTNPDEESRARYVSVAKYLSIQCRCFVFNTSIAQIKHNERFRELTDKSHKPVNDIIINGYKKKYVEPTTSEGFSSIVKVNCVPKFTDPELEGKYRMFLMEK